MDRPLTTGTIRRQRLRGAAKISVPVAALAVVLALLPGWMRPTVTRARIRTAVVRPDRSGDYRVGHGEVNNSVTASNSLLTSALTYGSELSAASRPDFEHALGVVIERTEQLNRFMRRFADVFRLPAPVKKPEALLPMLERNVRLLSAPDAARVTWLWDVDDRDLIVPLDRGQIEQAILNVLQNAVDATGGEGTGAIRLTRRTARGRPW